MLLFAAVLAVTAFGLSLPTFDRLGSYLMVAAAMALAALVVSRWRTPKH